MRRIGELLYVITDRRAAAGGSLGRQIAEALAAASRGTVLVQLREKDLCGRELYELAAEQRELTRRAGARLLINDRVDVALAVGADGVHLPEDGLPVAEARALLGPDRLVGASAHCATSAADKAAAGADLVTFGPVWETPSKLRYGPPAGVAALARAAAAVAQAAAGSAVFALGGVDSPGRAAEAMRAGAAGVAVVRAVLAAADAGAAATALVEAAQEGRR